jgi:hypothetical protein
MYIIHSYYSGFLRNARVINWAALLLFFAFSHKSQLPCGACVMCMRMRTMVPANADGTWLKEQWFPEGLVAWCKHG